jgi:hypothetical protein
MFFLGLLVIVGREQGRSHKAEGKLREGKNTKNIEKNRIFATVFK